MTDQPDPPPQDRMEALQARLMADARDRREAMIAHAIERAREALLRGGEPDPAWSMGEKLLTALVFRRPDQLQRLDYTDDEAADRLRYDFGANRDEFDGILQQIRAKA